MATYELIIKDETSGKGSNVSGQEEKKKKDEKKEENISKENGTLALMVAEMGINLSKQLVISKIGEFTRDSLLQQKIDYGFELLDVGTSFMINPALGSIHLATQVVNKTINYAITEQKSRATTTIMGTRAGYINRSRD